jgi:hypothetical protein
MPLDLFAGMCEGIPDATRRDAAMLVHSTTNLIGVGLEGRIPENLRRKCWMYFPEDNCPFYRATVFSHYSRFNVPAPENQWSLMAEVSESKHKPVNPATIKDETVRGLIATKLMDPKDRILSLVHYRFPYGYPVPSLRREEILTKVQPVLEAKGIYSRGRFGGWRYEVSNQDHSLMQGVEWADHVVVGAPEETYFCQKGLGPKEKPLPRPKAA